MKIVLKIILTFCILSLVQCRDDDDSSKDPDYGWQYFKCKINGVEFRNSGSPFTCESLDFLYAPIAYDDFAAGRTIMRGKNCQENTSLTIRINGLEPKIGRLDFINPSFADSIFPYYQYRDNENFFSRKIETLVEGEMNIIHFIPRKEGSNQYGSIKGTFNFVLTDTLGQDTLRITDGQFRFDVPSIF